MRTHDERGLVTPDLVVATRAVATPSRRRQGPAASLPLTLRFSFGLRPVP